MSSHLKVSSTVTLNVPHRKPNIKVERHVVSDDNEKGRRKSVQAIRLNEHLKTGGVLPSNISKQGRVITSPKKNSTTSPKRTSSKKTGKNKSKISNDNRKGGKDCHHEKRDNLQQQVDHLTGELSKLQILLKQQKGRSSPENSLEAVSCNIKCKSDASASNGNTAAEHLSAADYFSLITDMNQHLLLESYDPGQFTEKPQDRQILRKDCFSSTQNQRMSEYERAQILKTIRSELEEWRLEETYE